MFSCMLLLGALFALFMAGFWLYCLVDVALTPGDECPGLPKAAWIALVGGTFIIGAAMWLAVRRPARPTLPPGPPGHDRGDPSLPRAPQSRGGAAPRHFRPGRRARNGNDLAGGGPGRGGLARGGPGGGEGPVGYGRPGAEAAALLRHPAGRSRPRSASGRSGPKGPDDDPEFLSSLNRAIHGAESTETGDDQAGWPGEER
jgi:hypothetical protein